MAERGRCPSRSDSVAAPRDKCGAVGECSPCDVRQRALPLERKARETRKPRGASITFVGSLLRPRQQRAEDNDFACAELGGAVGNAIHPCGHR